MTTREGSLGGKDMKLVKRVKEKIRKRHRLYNNASTLTNSDKDTYHEHYSTDTDDDESTEFVLNNYQKNMLKNRENKRLNLSFEDNVEGDWKNELCLIGDKYWSSNRCLTETVSAVLKSGGTNPNDIRLSVNTIRRKRSKLRHATAKSIDTIKTNNLKNKKWALHWDSKTLKPLTHVGDKEERIAVLLKSGRDEFLLQIIKLDGKADASNEANAILSVLQSYGVEYKDISALVFDTTALNTGTKTGIVVQLERKMNKKLIQLPCRHHYIELVASACCSVVYSSSSIATSSKSTTSPFEPIFVSFKKVWNSLNQSRFETFERKDCSRDLIGNVNETVEFLQNWLSNDGKNCARKDYKELAILALIFLNGSNKFTENYKLLAPGACHHARWMSRIIYTFKIALLRNQLHDTFNLDLLNNITSLALFFAVFYVKQWFGASVGCEAPKSDLLWLKQFHKILLHSTRFPKLFSKLAVVSKQKLLDHTWYLSERLVTFSLFSDQITIDEKQVIRKAILSHQKNQTNSDMQLPQINSYQCELLQLKDFVGPDSWTFLNLLVLNDESSNASTSKSHALDFMNHHPTNWGQLSSYTDMVDRVKSLPVVNDAAERALGLLTEFQRNTTPKSEHQKQCLYKIVKEMRNKQYNKATSSERVTKKQIFDTVYKW